MKKKRLNRDAWGFQFFPYYQMRIDCDIFHGMISYIKLVDGEMQYWETPKAGRLAVCGGGMCWLQLLPDDTKRLITVKYFEDGKVDTARTNYPAWAREVLCPSVWYVDVIEDYEYAEDGMLVYTDKYADVIFTPEGDMVVDDLDELNEAYESGELTKSQYDQALEEVELIKENLCQDLEATAKWCAEIKKIVDGKIADGYKPLFSEED